MKIVNFEVNSPIGPIRRLGILEGDRIIDANLCWQTYFKNEGFHSFKEKAFHKMPDSLYALLKSDEAPIESLQKTLELSKKIEGEFIFKSRDIQLRAPIDKIETYRDFYAHEKHVAKGFEKRGEPIPKDWYEIPAYYKGPSVGFIGPDEEILWPSYTRILDFELELAIIIGRDGKNIKEANAHKHIFGYTILNDISARDMQKKEMAIRLGPAKGKDFCSVIGPVITTFDEFNFKEPNLKMTATINGEKWSEGQSGDSYYSFSQMVEHVARDEWVLAADLMGSGTVGTGCGLELDRWIQSGDKITLEIEKIGKLTNKVGGPSGKL